MSDALFGGKHVVQLDGQVADQHTLVSRCKEARDVQRLRIADDEGQIGRAEGMIGLGNLVNGVGQRVDAGASAGLQQEASGSHRNNAFLQGRAGRGQRRGMVGVTGGMQRGFHRFSLFQVERIPHAQKGALQGTAKEGSYSGRVTAARGSG